MGSLSYFISYKINSGILSLGQSGSHELTLAALKAQWCLSLPRKGHQKYSMPSSDMLAFITLSDVPTNIVLITCWAYRNEVSHFPLNVLSQDSQEPWSLTVTLAQAKSHRCAWALCTCFPKPSRAGAVNPALNPPTLQVHSSCAETLNPSITPPLLFAQRFPFICKNKHLKAQLSSKKPKSTKSRDPSLEFITGTWSRNTARPYPSAAAW